MGRLHQVLAAMRPKCIYRPSDLAESLHMQTGEVGEILKMLLNGNMIELVESDDGYRRKAVYSTKQNDLFH